MFHADHVIAVVGLSVLQPALVVSIELSFVIRSHALGLRESRQSEYEHQREDSEQSLHKILRQ